MNYPIARSESLIVQELPDELLICDTETYRAFCLNKTAAEVWKICDGQTSVPEIARRLSKKNGTPVSEEVVWLALAQLSGENLLEKKVEPNKAFSGLSRREVIRRIGLTSMVALPVISALAVPAAAQAQSAGSCTPPSNSGDVEINCPCVFGGDCETNCCDSGTCAPPFVCSAGGGGLNDPCSTSFDCSDGLECCAPSNPVCSFGC